MKDFAATLNLPWAQGVGRSNRPAPTNYVPRVGLPGG
jgi:hypothetical protein